VAAAWHAVCLAAPLSSKDGSWDKVFGRLEREAKIKSLRRAPRVQPRSWGALSPKTGFLESFNLTGYTVCFSAIC
jgi:hypothetical protein